MRRPRCDVRSFPRNFRNWRCRRECRRASCAVFRTVSCWWLRSEGEMRSIDIAIIGGSLAGSACVRELTRAGIDAVAIERDRFPREKVCGGFLSPGAVDILEEMNLLDTLRSAGAEVVRSARVRTASGTAG